MHKSKAYPKGQGEFAGTAKRMHPGVHPASKSASHHKNKVFAMLFTILLAAVFITVSMFCVRKLIKQKEASLLRGSGTIEQTAPVSAGLDSGKGEKISLSVEDIQNVVENWNNRIGYFVHDPVEGQITMNEAVRTVDDWLPKMGISDGILSGNSTIRSSLNVAKIKGEKAELLSPVYSFWIVEVAGDELEGTFYVNAVTGQIWEANVTLFAEVEDLSGSQLLDSFIRLAGLEPKKQEDSNSMESVAETGTSAASEENWEISLEIKDSSMVAIVSGIRYLTYADAAEEYYNMKEYDNSGNSSQKTASQIPCASIYFNIYVE